MTILRAIIAHWRLLAASLVGAAIVHIWATLAATDQEVMPGYAALTANLPVNQITYLDPISPDNQPLPFLMPDTLYAICRFDTSEGSMRLKATLPEAGWSLSLHAPSGSNYYFVPGTDQRVTSLDLILQTAGAAFLTAPDPTSPGTVARPKVLLPNAHGIAVLRAPIKGLAYRRLSDELRSTFSCAPLTSGLASR